MKYKKGDLVKVIELMSFEEELYGVRGGKTYEVLDETDDGVYINDGKGDRLMYHYQLEKVKKKSKKDLSYWKNNCEENYMTTPISVLRYITELENTIEQMKDILNK